MTLETVIKLSHIESVIAHDEYDYNTAPHLHDTDAVIEALNTLLRLSRVHIQVTFIPLLIVNSIFCLKWSEMLLIIT